MAKRNKAHRATANRIAKRYGGEVDGDNGSTIRTPDMLIEVQIQPTLGRGISRLKKAEGPVYVAVTNKEALPDAVRLCNGTTVGVMDPRGNIVKNAVAPEPPANQSKSRSTARRRQKTKTSGP